MRFKRGLQGVSAPDQFYLVILSINSVDICKITIVESVSSSIKNYTQIFEFDIKI